MGPIPDMLAQDGEGGGWQNLIVIFVLVVLPMLSKLGKKLRERFGKEQEDEDAILELDVESRPKQAGPPQPSIPPVIGRSRSHEAQPERIIATPRRIRPPTARPVARARGSVSSTQPPPVPRRRPKPSRAVPPPDLVSEEVGIIAQSLTAAVGERTSAPGKSARDADARLIPSRLRAADLRSAVVLSEILQPPLALRSPQ